ncbi:MAG: cytochrome C biogenesis protein ResB [Geobacteraceae bacterium GWC2_55_20]|nr:MAG: cytochrome C biogenesis protein ResB [Geobacteraceae bacterium GWC2_55_20]OGU19820.1 MAG: cytochrome C biogenesis protein ResB [Geobacteraceae bacterium GWF2_54_21]HBA73429.1 cytochrome c biogenesis protein ResB [Geobacter sp.]HCE69381.1 cytochrome c biogenesis protein ResB [Geobacter sp.]
MTNNKRDFLQSLWDFFCSLKLTMSLLIGLALISIIGTIIPQGSLPPEYVQAISPAKLKLYKTLGFFDMYHSWWFILLLYLLTVNLVACSIKRLPHIWKTITNPVTIFNSALEKSLSGVTEFPHTGEPAVVKERVAAFLKIEFAEPVVTESGGDWHLFAQKTPWCRLAVYCVHLSVIIIFIGAIIGSVFGYKGFVNIMEGESVSKVMSRSNEEIDLGFSLRCEQFSVAHYASGAPKEFKSILTVLENGRPVPDYTNARVIVNDPLTYKGITFYQSSYGNAGNYFFTVSDLSGKNPVPLTIEGKSSVTLPDGSSLHVIEATRDVAEFAPGLSGPAAQVELHAANGKSESFVVYANHPELNIQHAQQHGGGPVIHYKGAQERMYTGLQVAKDPGVEVVWLGCLLMVIGIYAAFFMSHRRVWVRIQNGVVTIGGNASKNQAGFQLCLDRLASKLKTDLSGEEKP